MSTRLSTPFGRKLRHGTVNVRLEDHGDRVSVVVEDDGQGLPEGFRVGATRSLGLHIVEVLVTEDLKGEFEIRRRSGKGAMAVATFPKTPTGGDEGWNEDE